VVLGFDSRSASKSPNSPNPRTHSVSSYDEGSPHPINLYSTQKKIEIKDQMKQALNPLSKARSIKDL